jgi:Ser/Thr protein kinase RdoA (MazF antagonist)
MRRALRGGGHSPTDLASGVGVRGALARPPAAVFAQGQKNIVGAGSAAADQGAGRIPGHGRQFPNGIERSHAGDDELRLSSLPPCSLPPLTRRLTLDVTKAQVDRVLTALDAPLRAASLARLHGGSTEVYRIDIADRADPIVLKIYRDDPAWAPGKEALIASWIGDRDLGVRTPRWLRLDETRSLLPLRYALITFLPGQAVRSLADQPDVEPVYRRMGALLRRVHAIPMPAYGYILADGVFEPRAGNGPYMTAAFQRAFRRFRRQGGGDALADRLEAMARERYGLLDLAAGPVLCHDDFQPRNVLATRDASGELVLTGLIDFANALAGDPLADLAKTLFCCAHEDPRSVGPLREGYGPIDHPDPEAALWLYTLYHRLVMWTFLTGLGDDPASAGPTALTADLAAMAGP